MTQPAQSADLARLLHHLDGHLGLAVYRGEARSEEWIECSKKLIGQIRQAIKDLENA